MDNLTIHFMNKSDHECVAELNPSALSQFLVENAKVVGRELADKLTNSLVITNNDPRMSELEETDIFLSYNDIVSSRMSGERLRYEIPDEFLDQGLNELHAAETDF